MAGHNKWSKIKRGKAIKDGKKAASFAKLSHKITLAAKGGSSDPKMNFKLKSMIDHAKAAGMTKANIDQAIKKADSKDSASVMQELSYEGYLPGGVAVQVFVATDNTNRSFKDVKHAFTKNNGDLGSPGCVSYLFQEKAYLLLDEVSDEEKLLEDLLECELADYEEGTVKGSYYVYLTANDLDKSAQQLIDAGYKISESNTMYQADLEIEVSDEEQLKSVNKALDMLDELDDVVDVAHNAILPL
jgi:YebC/PmpR family DNA-binding regulatory protein